MSHSQSGWSEVVGEKPQGDSRDQVRHSLLKGTVSKEDVVGGRVRVTTAEERVLRAGWTRLCR